MSFANGNINWTAVAQNLTRPGFILVRGTEGVETVDPNFEQNFNGSKKAGIPTGFTHSFRTKEGNRVANITQQVDHIERRMKQVGFDPRTDFFVLSMLNEEKHPGIRPAAGMNQSELFNIDISAKIKSLLDQVKRRLNVDPLIFTRKSFWDSVVHTPSISMSPYGLWLALENDQVIETERRDCKCNLFSCNCSTRLLRPDLPKGFTTAKYWQFSQTFRVLGISGPVGAHYKDGR